MKYIIAIIKPHKIDDVMKALEEVDVNLMTVSNVLGRGRQMGVTEVYRGTKEVGSLLKKVKLEIAVNEDFVDPTHPGHHQGRPHGRDRRRQDLRAGSSRCLSDPNR